MRRGVFLIAALALLVASPARSAPKKKKAEVAVAAKPTPSVPTANEKAVLELMAPWKWGMSVDETLGVLAKQLADRKAPELAKITDVYERTKIGKDIRATVEDVRRTTIKFEGQRTGWDVSIIEGEFLHKNGESMMQYREIDPATGRDQQRFFFFKDGKLWKMFVSLDVSILPEDKKNFDTFAKVMQGQYGAGDVETGVITWRTGEFHVRAVDKLKTYDALGLVIEDPRVKQELVATREAKAPPKKETNAVIKAVIDTDKTSKPDVKQNSGAVDAVLKAQGGGTPAPK